MFSVTGFLLLLIRDVHYEIFCFVDTCGFNWFLRVLCIYIHVIMCLPWYTGCSKIQVITFNRSVMPLQNWPAMLIISTWRKESKFWLVLRALLFHVVLRPEISFLALLVLWSVLRALLLSVRYNLRLSSLAASNLF